MYTSSAVYLIIIPMPFSVIGKSYYQYFMYIFESLINVQYYLFGLVNSCDNFKFENHSKVWRVKKRKLIFFLEVPCDLRWPRQYIARCANIRLFGSLPKTITNLSREIGNGLEWTRLRPFKLVILHLINVIGS